ncbi:L,D-transpeptidase [Pseudoroseicyclus aestuarii]|uniref:Lipoprotein-anchoring transpeptidase ErfK/SrfK n=1 Tax=Pseudoroseicyclus aestuarii TaxID=1795041 RepID=A0A318T3L3_9RHOB|nr:L,D-transpeptidase [Pseudoroseicyclus aestuarii]PYE84814.1 lipoprotein-anchoring transpeptidase ErfK/SrfK [Pseudoroseicyclus aestuarii]
MLTRRTFLAAAPAGALAACARPAPEPAPLPELPPAPPPPPPMPARYGAVLDEPYPVPAVPAGVVPEELWRQEVDNPFPNEAPGTVIVDPDAGFLHLVQDNPSRAWRYGAGVGAAGFDWDGEAVVQYGREWPTWRVPQEMIERRPELEPYSVANGGMPPGPENPLGARALYLFKNGEDTLYRIHGACEPEYLGKAVSSGCIRLLDQDAIDIYDRVPHHAKVIVLPSLKPEGLGAVY